MRPLRIGICRRSISLGAAVAAAAIGLGQTPANATHSTVTAVAGHAEGYYLSASLFGGPPNIRGPEPTVTLAPDASNSPQDATVSSASAVVGPATFFTSGPITVHTEGALGDAGGASTSTSISNINTSGSEAFTASNLTSTCTATPSGTSGSTTITGGTLYLDSGDDINDDGDFVDEGEHAPVIVNLGTAPAPNTTYEGHIHVNDAIDNFRYVFNEQVTNPDGSLTVYGAHQYLLGPTAVGDLYLAQSTCGATLEPAVHPNPPADISVGDITDAPDPVAPLAAVTYTIPVTNNGPEDAAGVTLLSTVSGLRGASVASATTSDGGTCTLLKGKTKGASCELGTIAAGQTETVTITLNAPRKQGTMRLTSTSSYAGDSNAANNTAFEDTVVEKPAA